VSEGLPNESLRVDGYARVSTQDQAEHGVSMIDQPARIRAYCLAHQLDLRQVHEDAGEFSGTLNRPGLKAALARLDAGEVNGLVVVRMNRLSRHVGHVAQLVEIGAYGQSWVRNNGRSEGRAAIEEGPAGGLGPLRGRP
jgi:predicted site-specific integrase-resolvase